MICSFTRGPIQYALETDWLVEAAGFEPLHLEIDLLNLTVQTGAGPPVSV